MQHAWLGKFRFLLEINSHKSSAYSVLCRLVYVSGCAKLGQEREVQVTQVPEQREWIKRHLMAIHVLLLFTFSVFLLDIFLMA